MRTVLLSIFLFLFCSRFFPVLSLGPTWQCPYEVAPKSLNGAGLLGFSNELHVQGTFQLELVDNSHKIYFTLPDSFFTPDFRVYSCRFYLTAQNIDLDLFLWQDGGDRSLLATSSLGTATAEVIQYNVTAPGTYYLELHSWGFSGGSSACVAAHLEIAVFPRELLAARGRQWPCPPSPSDEFIPLGYDIFQPLSQGLPVHYNSEQDPHRPPDVGFVVPANGPVQTNARPSDQIRWIQPYLFTVPMSSAHSVWRFRLDLGAYFPVGGSLGMLLIPSRNLPTPTAVPSVAACLAAKLCTIGRNVLMNTYTLQTLLFPGDYTLWFFDVLGEKDRFVMPCTPFTLRVDVEPVAAEPDVYTCGADAWPTDLNLPGLISPLDGSLYYYDQPFVDLSAPALVTDFAVDVADTLFRARFTATDMQVSMTLLSLQGDNDATAVASVTEALGPAASLFGVLAPGRYQLRVEALPLQGANTCPIANPLQIGLLPLALLRDTLDCLSTNASVPSLDFYELHAGRHYGPRTISLGYAHAHLVHEFAVVENLVLSIDIASEFVPGDVAVTLYPFDNSTAALARIVPSDRRNHYAVEWSLERGAYSLDVRALALPPFAAGTAAGFPFDRASCFQLSVDVQTRSPGATAASACPLAAFPADFTGYEYLGSSLANQFHVVNTFRVPPFADSARQVTAVTAVTCSGDMTFRVRVDSNTFDVDVRLRSAADGATLARSDSISNSAEELAFDMPAGDYSLELTFKASAQLLQSQLRSGCFPFTAELAMAPPVAGDLIECSDAQLPASDLLAQLVQELAASASGRVAVTDTYGYDQRVRPQGLAFELPFVVAANTSVLLSAAAASDFLLADVALQLINENDKSSHYSQSAYSTQRLDAVVLAPGRYTLAIVGGPQLAVPRCVGFQLTLLLETYSRSASADSSLAGCPQPSLPDSLNSVSALSVLSGRQTHFSNQFLVDVDDGEHNVAFDVESPSLFRVRVPAQRGIDIDVLLLDLSNGDVALIADGSGEKALSSVLQPGAYALQLRFRGDSASDPLPALDACAAFALQLAVVPVEWYVTSAGGSWQAGRCPDQSTSPQLALARGNTTAVQQLAVGGAPPSLFDPARVLSFRTTSPVSRFYYQAVADFLLGDVSLSLAGVLDSGRQVAYAGVMGMNYEYVDVALPPGQYLLTLRDPAPGLLSTPPVHCVDYDLYSLLDESPGQLQLCSQEQSLPTDTYSASGGSAAFGGPQPSGSDEVRLTGAHFLMGAQGSSQTIKFYVTHQTALVHAATWTDLLNNDIDLAVYRDAQHTSLVGISFASGPVESGVWHVEPKDTPYYLVVYFFSSRDSELCPTFHFDFAITYNSTLQSAMRCSAPLPEPATPPAGLAVDADTPVHLGPQRFVFTPDAMPQLSTPGYAGRLVYPIAVQVTAQSAQLLAYVGSNFAADDFNLKLRAADGSLLEDGFPIRVANTQGLINWRRALSYSLPAGSYSLEIVDQLSTAVGNADSLCHYFELFVSIAPPSDADGSHVVAVNPAGGAGFDPYANLLVDVYFSSPVSSPAPADVAAFLAENRAVYLSLRQANTTGAAVEQRPAFAYYSYEQTVLSVVFFAAQAFAPGQTWALHVDAQQFLDSSGLPFLAYPDVNTFAMTPCDCRGHGACLANGTCDCYALYAGADCSACVDGYHLVGDACQPNAQCDESTCHGHGTCSVADDGSLTCACERGYLQIDQCSSCADGYARNDTLGTCTPAAPLFSSCDLPLFPSDLNSLAYLGRAGVLHIQDTYMVDLVSRTTVLPFSVVGEQSVFRVVASASQIDFSVLLLRIELGTHLQAWSSRTSTGLDIESVFALLDEGDYQLEFVVNSWSSSISPDAYPCVGMDVQLAVMPRSQFDRVDGRFKENYPCAEQSTLPLSPVSEGDLYTVPFGGASFSTPVLTLNANASLYQTGQPNFFFAWHFAVRTEIEPQVMHFRANVGSRFLSGPVSILLEADGDDHCGSLSAPNGRCYLGSSVENLNVLEMYLSPGEYTLWLFEMRPQNPALTSCIPYDLFVSFTPEDAPSSRCEIARLPATLNAPGLLASSDDVHLQGSFLLERTATIDFTLDANASYVLRLSDQSDVGAAADWQLLERSSDDNNNNNNDDDDDDRLVARSTLGQLLVASLGPGVYRLVHTVGEVSLDPSLNCKSFNFELALRRSDAEPDCTAVTSDVLPPIGPTLSAPLAFAPPLATFQAVYAGRPEIVAYSIVVPSSTAQLLGASVDFDFVSAPLSLLLWKNGSAFAAGTNNYNQNRLTAVLTEGSYVLQLSWADPVLSRPGACALFQLAVGLSEVGRSRACAQGQPVPRSLNSERLQPLADSDAVHFYASDLLVPTARSSHTTIRVAEPSLLRVYVDPSAVDIDLAVYEGSSPTSVSQSLTPGAWKEETLLATLLPNRNYDLVLTYSSATPLPSCYQFAMQVAVGPLEPADAACPNGGSDNWPIDIGSLATPVVGADYWYCQQQANTPQQHVLRFSVPSVSDLRVNLFTDFLHGDLSLAVHREDQAQERLAAATQFGRTLTVLNLPIGEYTLHLYEPAVLPTDALGCLYFGVQLTLTPSAVAAAAGRAAALPLPASLDRLPFLLYDGVVDVESYFALSDEPVTFTLIESTQLRLSALMPRLSDAVSVRVESATAGVVAASTPLDDGDDHQAVLLTTLPAGVYSLHFDFSTTTTSRSTAAAHQGYLSLGIVPASYLSSVLDAVSLPVECATSPLPELTITPDLTGTLSAVDLLTPWSLADANATLYRIAISVAQPVVVFAQSEYAFPLDQLQLALYARGSKQIVGKPGDHFSQLNSLVAPGSYELVVSQVGVMSPPHCVASSLRVFVRPAADGLDFQDCSSQLTAPFDLTTSRGGGPIDAYGALSIYGRYLLVDNRPLSIWSTLLQPSLMSVYVYPLEPQLGTYATLTALPSGQVAAPAYHPRHSVVNWNAYELAAGNYTNEIRIDISSSWAKCPTFILHIQLDSKQHLFNMLGCAAGTVVDVSSTQLALNGAGFGARSYSGVVPLLRLQSPAPIELFVDVAQTSLVRTAVSFNSLISDFNVQVRQVNGSSGDFAPFSMLTALPQESTSGIADMQRTASFTLSADQPTRYAVRLLPTTFSTDFDGQQPYADGLCLPLSWDVLVTPLTSSVPYVTSVTPTRGSELPVRQYLTVRIATHGVYQSIMANNDGVFTAATPGDIQTAFVLRSVDAPEQALLADSASVDHSICSLTFTGPSLYEFIAASSRRLELVLVPQRLYNSNRQEIVMFDEHVYQFVDPACSGHGQLDDIGQCVCDDGYARQSCQICQVGYHFVDSNTQCLPDGAAEQCTELSCWGHGSCDDSTGVVRCTCEPGYAQPDCGACVPPLLLDPVSKQCRPAGSCAADTCHQHGSCDDAGGVPVCTCDDGYLAPDCQYCADGYLLNPQTNECVARPACDPATCSGHGDCHEPDPNSGSLDLVCTCDPGYSGAHCTDCGMNFEPCAGGCCPSVPCTNATCSGHGVCDDSSGQASCSCAGGRYALPDCGRCSAGYVNYPACTPAAPPSLLCDVPVLPLSLDEVGFLLDDGDVHLQGRYYMDLSSQSHDIGFSLTQTSALRAYVEPYAIDIDMFLFEVLPGGRMQLLQMSIDSHTEEDIFALLDVPDGDTKQYVLRLSYLIWSDPSLQLSTLDTLCKTFNFELAVSPVALVQYIEYLYNGDDGCAAALPALPAGGYTVADDFHFADYAGYRVPAPADTQQAAFYFWAWRFHVPDSLAAQGKFVTLNAEVGYRFLPGQIAVMIQTDDQTGSQPHCGGGENPSLKSGCYTGRNAANRQILTAALSGGNYTLWLYQPTMQNPDVASCAHFDFRLDMTVSDLPETVFSCDLLPLPATLHVAGYFQPDGSLHVADRFLFSATRTTTFTVNATSVLSLSSSSPLSPSVDASFELSDAASGASLGSIALGGSGAVELAAGSYALALAVHGVGGDVPGDFCAPLLLDLAIVPRSLINAHPCPLAQLPSFSRQQLSAPFAFDADTTFCALSAGTSATVFSFDVAVRSTPTLLQLRLDRPAYAGLHVAVRKKATAALVASSDSVYNRQTVALVLQPDASNSLIIYTVAVEWAWGRQLLQSAPFNVNVLLSPVDLDAASTTLCLTGEQIPDVLPSVRYATSDDDRSFEFFSNLFFVPSPPLSSHTIAIRPSEILPGGGGGGNVFFRVHVESTDVLDVSCALFDTSSGAAVLLASSDSSGAGREKVLTAVLLGAKTYSLVLAFTASASLPPCSYFAMGLSAQPTADYSSLQCANSLPPADIPSDGYDSVELGDELYYTRGAGAPLTYSMRLVRTETFDLHAEVFSEFLTGDVGMQLLSAAGSPLATAVSHFGGRSLSLTDVPAGHYVLRLYEPAAFLPDFPGCTRFTFSVLFGAATRQTVVASPFGRAFTAGMPTTLDRIPFLAYDENAVFVDDFYFWPAAPRTIAFSTQSSSLFRFAALPQAADVQLQATLAGTAIQTTTAAVGDDFVHGSQLSLTLPPGNYTLTMTAAPRALSRSPHADYATVTVSLAVQPISQYQALVDYLAGQYPAQCTDSPAVELSPSGSGVALFHDGRLAMSAASSYYRVFVRLDSAATVFAQLAFAFPMNDLVLALVADSSAAPLVQPKGNEGVYQVNTVLPAGDYYLDVRPLTADPPPPHCRVFSLRIIASDASLAPPNAQCSGYDVAPWNLNTPDGGSAPYGGPIENDRLSLYGGQFLLASQHALSNSARIAMRFDTPSYVSVFVKGTDLAYWRQVTATVAAAGSNASYVPYLLASSQKSQLVSFLLPAGDAQLGLQLQLASVTYHLPCLSYELAVLARSADLLASSFLCAATDNDQDLGALDVSIDSQGFAYTAVDSFFRDPSANDTFLMPVQAAAAPSFVSFEASLLFDSLGVAARLDLVSISGGGQTTVLAASTLDAVPSFNAGGMNMIASLSRVLSKTALTNLYLRLVVDGLPGDAFAQPLCVPFSLRAAAAPYPSTSYLLVQSVVPSSVQYLSPTQQLSLRVQFNQEPLYTADGSALTPAALLAATSLRQQCDCEAPQVFHARSVDGGGSVWTLHFAPLPAGATFALALDADAVFLADGATAAQLLTSHTYHVTDSSCSSHGAFQPDQGYCVCDQGYTLPECSSCAAGYRPVTQGTGALLVCQPSGDSTTTSTSTTTTTRTGTTTTTKSGTTTTTKSTKSTKTTTTTAPTTRTTTTTTTTTPAPPSNETTTTTTTTTTPSRSTRTTTTTTTTTTSASNGCRLESCSCFNENRTSGVCQPIGTCLGVDDESGLAVCECPDGFDAAKQCGACSAGYLGYPTCYLDPASCLALCEHGACLTNNATQMDECVCSDGWMGKQCDQVDTCSTSCIANQGTCTKNPRTGLLDCICNPGYSGKDCATIEQKISAAEVIGIVIAAIFLLLHVAFLIWWTVKRGRDHKTYSPVLDLDDPNTGIPSDSSDDDPFSPSSSSSSSSSSSNPLRFSSDDDFTLHLNQPEPRVLDLHGTREKLIGEDSDDDLFSGL